MADESYIHYVIKVGLLLFTVLFVFFVIFEFFNP